MKKILAPKIWLIIITLMHTCMGVLMPLIQIGNNENLGVFLYFFVISVPLIYVIFFTKDQNQARLSTVLCAPVVFWFIISGIMKLKIYDFPIAKMPDSIIPILFWTMPVVTGILNWNTNQDI